MSLSAQDFRAQISGQVVDQTGAAIPGAKVKAVQKNTGQATETTTNHDGYYALTYLLPSDYDVEASATGFKTTRRENVTLLVSQKLDLPFKLEVGGISAEVTVTAEAPELIQTADASGGLNFDNLMTSEYALNGRQVYMLMDLTPGVLFTQEEFGATGFSGTRGWDVNSNYVMNGGKLGSNSFTLNGAPISLNGMWQVAPNVDAIQEFKVSTNQYDAAHGRTGGGSVNTTLKAGSNQWHGTLAHFMRNDKFDANYTQLNAAGKPRGKHIVNQFTGTLGGPLRKNKDFLFVSFEGWRERVPFPVVADTPPLDLRTGQAFTQYGVTYLIYDPLTAHPCVNNVDVTGNCSSPTIRNPFPGNVLPQSRISPIGQKLLSFYPTQNYPGLVDNYVAGTGGKYEYNQPMARWDRQINDSNRIFMVFTFQRGSEYRLSSGIPGPAAAGNMWSKRRNVNGIVDWTSVLSPTAVLDVRASYGRYWQIFPNTDFTTGVTAASIGMTGMIQAPTNPQPYPPRIAIDQYTNLFGTGSVQTFRSENQYNLAPSITMTRGTKTLKFGVDLLYVGQGISDTGNSKGLLSFTRWGTQRYPQRSALNAYDGNGIADILLGIPGSGQIDWNDTYYRSYPHYGVYVQNDWKLRRNLTLNIGLRYEVQIPHVERFDRQNTGFDYNAVNPLSDQILAKWRQYQAAYNATNPRYPYPDPPPAIYGGKTFIQPGGNRRIFDTDWTNIMPRVGLAWNFMKSTVLRTGFGVYYRPIISNSLTGETDGFSQTTNYTRSLDGDVTPSAGLTGRYSLQQPFPDGLTPPAGRSGGLLTNAGNAVTYSGRRRPIPRTYQYSFGFQRRAFWNILLDASYVGSQTIKDAMSVNTAYWSYEFNQLAYATNAYGTTALSNPFYGILPTNRTRGSSATVSRQELFRSMPLFPNVIISNMPWARYRYDALQLRADKRFTNDRSLLGGLTMVFSYTFSKNFQDANYLNTWNIDHEKPVHELVSYDKPQNLSYSGVWSLPWGKGRHFATPNKAVGAIIGGWTINWVYRYNSGNPVSGINAVNKCGTLLVKNQTHDRWWNNDKSCWAGNPSYTIRTVPDRYPWLRQMDNITTNLAGNKTFNITERWKLNLRGEAFNLFNRPIYRPAPTSYTDVNFGKLSIEQQNFPRNIQVAAKIIF